MLRQLLLHFLHFPLLAGEGQFEEVVVSLRVLLPLALGTAIVKRKSEGDGIEEGAV